MYIFRINKIARNLILINIITFSCGNSILADAITDKRLNFAQKSQIPKNEIELKIVEKIKINLDDIDSILEENNLEIRNEKLKVEQSKLQLRSAISAWYPTLSLNSNGLPKYLDGYTYNQPNSSNNTLSRQLSASISAEVKWDLINPLRKPEINSSRDKFEKSKLNYLIKFRDIKHNTIKDYHLLQQAIEEVKVANKSVEYSEISMKEALIRMEAGIGTKLELLEAKTQLSRDRKLLANKLGNQKIKERSLTNSLNLPSNRKATISSAPIISRTWEVSLEETILSAYKHRKELDNILLDISINNNNAKTAAASKKPTVSIFNTLSTSFNKGQTLVSSPSMDNSSSIINNTIGISATWKLIDGGKSRSLYLYNKSKENNFNNEFQKKLSEIRGEVEKSFIQFKTEEKNILTTANEVKTAEESLRLVKLKFEAGISTQREIVNHQRDLTEAEVNHIKSITNYNIHLSELSRQTGIDPISFCKKNTLSKSKKAIELKRLNLFTICK